MLSSIFLKAIPKKILIFLGTLFLLIMMVAILICIFVVMLMISYAKLHSSLLMDWFHPTCCSIHLFKSLRRLFCMKIPYCNVMIEFELPFIDFDYVSLKNAVNM